MASTTTCFAPGRCTTKSGRSIWPSDTAAVCSSKSQYGNIPAASTTRRSCISPQRPRTVGARSAVTRLAVSRRRRSWPSAREARYSRSAPSASARSVSSLRTPPSSLSICCFTGPTTCSIALRLSSRPWRLPSCRRSTASAESARTASVISSLNAGRSEAALRSSSSAVASTVWRVRMTSQAAVAPTASPTRRRTTSKASPAFPWASEGSGAVGRSRRKWP